MLSENQTVEVRKQLTEDWGMLNAVPIPLLIFDKCSLQIIFVNRAFCHSVNLPSSELTHQKVEDLHIWRDNPSKNSFLAYVLGRETTQGKQFAFRKHNNDSFNGWVFTNTLSLNSSLKLITIIDQSSFQESPTRLLEELRQQVTTDPLTQIPNRRFFLEIAEKTLQEAQRREQPIALILLDINALKSINDSYGEFAGDRILVQLAKKVLQNIREGDLFGRFGGDEFLLLLPQTDVAEAKRVIHRLKEKIGQSFIMMGNKPISYTISYGIAYLQSSNDKIGDLIRRADVSLYKTKNPIMKSAKYF